MRNYELMLLFRVLGEDGAIPQAVEAVTELIENHGGKVNAIDRWGRRKLAYPIDNQSEGVYILLKPSIEPSALREIEFNLKLNENLLRYMFVKADESLAAATADEDASEEDAETVEAVAAETSVVEDAAAADDTEAIAA